MNVTTLNTTTLDGGNVIIKKGGGTTPTPPSGGVRSSWRYFDVSKAADGTIDQGFMVNIARIGDEVYAASFVGSIGWDKVTAVGVDGNGIVMVADGTALTWNEVMAMEGLTPEVMEQMNVIEITEEEFLTKTFE